MSRLKLYNLIYKDPVFRRLLDAQAAIEGNWGVHRRLAALSTACETNTKEFAVCVERKI